MQDFIKTLESCDINDNDALNEKVQDGRTWLEGFEGRDLAPKDRRLLTGAGLAVFDFCVHSSAGMNGQIHANCELTSFCLCPYNDMDSESVIRRLCRPRLRRSSGPAASIGLRPACEGLRESWEKSL